MHGHVAVLNNKSTLMYITVDKISEHSAANLNKILKDYKPKLIIIGPNSDKIVADYNIFIECENEIQQMFANVVICQQIALEVALKLKRNVDNPKGLHKVVIDESR
jgi:glucosamine 6-phosphate synthetase-like amidotransferase/phosphosugar isomerase protein